MKTKSNLWHYIKSIKILLLYTKGSTLKDEIIYLTLLILFILKFISNRIINHHFIVGAHHLHIRFYCKIRFNNITLMLKPYTTYNFTHLNEKYELDNWFIPNAKGIVVDIGANYGVYTLIAAKQADTVIAIEPNSEILDMLKTNIEINCKNNNVILIKKAVGNVKRKITLKTPRVGNVNVVAHTSINPFISVHEYDGYIEEEVEMDTLDNIMNQLGIKHVDFMKVDIEGAEILMIEGAKQTLANTKYLMIERLKDEELILDELRRLGFKLVDESSMNLF